MNPLPDSPDFDHVDDVTWHSYRITAKVEQHGEVREQVVMGYNANHALERVSRASFPGVMHGADTVKAVWIDPEEYLYRNEKGK